MSRRRKSKKTPAGGWGLPPKARGVKTRIANTKLRMPRSHHVSTASRFISVAQDTKLFSDVNSSLFAYAAAAIDKVGDHCMPASRNCDQPRGKRSASLLQRPPFPGRRPFVAIPRAAQPD